MEVSLTQMEFKNIFNDAATRWEEDRSTGTECRSIDWAEIRPIYIMVVKNATKYWACMVYY